ncbi:PAS domain S-box protein [Bdellovibrio reynosensis]|uniref:histidine kinase n=1 Tax=Bdellovibrio reynosensis TaxID=2835041 RepID=A0ABY4C9N4_9BACT|nr:PAS domain S-box protein [Bdellovibrio reynosensis]UOF01578.1 PAS domain S-box protein [Bdellovibrio reynosensis]
MDSLDPVFFELSNEMMAIFDLNWKAVKLNSHWSTNLGYTKEELLNISFAELIHPDDLKYTAEIGERIKKEVVVGNVENRYRTKNGKYIYLRWNYKVDKDRGLVFTTATNITEQKVQEEIARQTNRVAGLGNWSVDLSTNQVYWSPEMWELFGLTPDFVQTKENWALTLETSLSFFGKDKEIVRQKYQNLVEKGETYDIEVSVSTPDGRNFPVRVIGAAMEENGVRSRTYGTIQDITKIKESEKILKYQQYLLNGIFEASPALIFVKDLEGKYILVSRKFEQFMGRTKAELLGRTDFDFFPDFAAKRFVRQDREVAASGVHVTFEDDVKNSDGQDKHYHTEKFPLSDENGKIIAVAGVASDITELHRYQKELVHAKEAAEFGTRAKSQFLANMSHEIRTPMNSIMGMADLLSESSLDEEQKEYVTILSRAAESLLNLINDILDLSKIESGLMTLDKEPFSLREAIAHSVEMLRIKATQKNLNLSYEVEEAVPQYIIGDSARVQQILVNLIGNAIKFTDAGEVKVQANFIKDRNEVEVVVEDTGIGLTAEQLKGLFTRFSQGDSSITRRFGGTGLGLSISKELVEKMGGFIGVQSKYHQGSKFFFTLQL